MTSNIWRVLDIFELQGRSIFDENISEANSHKFPSSVVDLHFTALIIEQSSKHKLQTAAGQNYRISEPYLIFVIFFTRAKFLENKIYTEKSRKL